MFFPQPHTVLGKFNKNTDKYSNENSLKCKKFFGQKYLVKYLIKTSKIK